MTQITTVDKLKDLVGTKDFSSLSDAQLGKFVELIPYIAKDVLIPIVSESRQITTAMIDASKNALSNVVSSANKSLEMHHETDLKTLEILHNAIQRDDITAEERRSYVDQVIEINKNSAKKDTEHKEYLRTVAKENSFSAEQFWGFVAEVVVPIATPILLEIGRLGLSQLFKGNKK